MITRQRRKSPLSRLWVPVLAVLFLAYFGYHAFTGSYGLWSLDRLEARGVTLKAQLETLKGERAASRAAGCIPQARQPRRGRHRH